MAAIKMFFITWFSSSTHLKVDLSILDISGFGYAGFSDLEYVWDDLLVFNQMVLIFYSFKGFSDLDLIYRFSDLEDFWDDLLVSHLKYNAPDDFPEVFQTTSRTSRKSSRKSSRRLPGSLPDDFQEVVWTSWKSSDEVFFHIKWSPSLSL
ncbi:hypothetical protein DY000_02015346 [Brassica cretica]|uniref:Uncharacterized protein n=1 Tax=Brassica cretica TaxID=69181 RepID=A0ABQ7CXX5_BRACR|nr:hypothetical protein DY000_02015346 [Brassica cretica]